MRRGFKVFIGFWKVLLKFGYYDLLRFFLKDDDKSILIDYEKILVVVRFLVIDIKSGINILKYGLEIRCKFVLDDKNDVFLIVLVYNGNVNIYLCYFIE